MEAAIWVLVGIVFVTVVALGFWIYQVSDALNTMETLLADVGEERRAIADERRLLAEMVAQVKTWIVTHESKSKDAVDTVKTITDEQTKSIERKVEEAVTKAVEIVAVSKTPSGHD